MSNNMEEIKSKIIDFLEDASSLIILGIGNDIRGDDGVGPYIINRIINLKEDVSNNNISNNVDMDAAIENNKSNDFSKNMEENIHLINGGTVPENFTGLIKKINPSHIIIIDASIMNKKPGQIEIYLKENISNVSISTHSMSLSYMVKYLELENQFELIFIGIEPKIMDLSLELSDIVKSSADDLIHIFESLFFK